ncbi:MAG TPA: hypothetical protein VMS18_29170 [Candidatus Binatia bacterium]|nr:hypothetical protein [Candidatus Binatia bacterium]
MAIAQWGIEQGTIDPRFAVRRACVWVGCYVRVGGQRGLPPVPRHRFAAYLALSPPSAIAKVTSMGNRRLIQLSEIENPAE